MKQANKMGLNRTGADMSPIDSKAMIEGAEKYTPELTSVRETRDFRKSYIQQSGAVGSVPLPGTFKGALSMGKEKLQGHTPEVLINKLGQRLAFERTGVRLYDALIEKCEATPDDVFVHLLSVDLLKQFRTEEAEHAMLVKQVIEKLGADPTAMTPDADVSAVASLGLTKVMTEPRTTVLQCLEALQIAELADNAAWENLRELCLSMGLNDIADEFGRALAQEKVHEETIGDWVRKLVLYKATG